jgi:hypothetical protein
LLFRSTRGPAGAKGPSRFCVRAFCPFHAQTNECSKSYTNGITLSLLQHLPGTSGKRQNDLLKRRPAFSDVRHIQICLTGCQTNLSVRQMSASKPLTPRPPLPSIACSLAPRGANALAPRGANALARRRSNGGSSVARRSNSYHDETFDRTGGP